MKLVFFKSSGHKYIKRTGTTGSYRYWYRDPATGDVYEGNQDGQRLANTSKGKPSGTKIGELTKKEDGFWYNKQNQKITNNDSKAESFATQSHEGKAPPQMEIGKTVRIKPTDKNTAAGREMRGAVTTIKEIGKDYVKIEDDKGRIFRVNKQALEVAKSMDVDFEVTFIKSTTGSIRSGHKYWKRTGTAGRYRYWYKNKQGKIVAGPKPATVSFKKDEESKRKIKNIKQTKEELLISATPKRERYKQLGTKLATGKITEKQFKKQKEYMRKIPVLPVAEALQEASKLENQKKLIVSRKNAGPDSDLTVIDQQQLQDQKHQIISTGEGKSKLAFIQKQINLAEKKKSPQQKTMVALKMETGEDDPKLLGFNLRNITKTQIKKLKSDSKLRNRFVIENEAIINEIASRMIKRSGSSNYESFSDAKQNAALGLLLAVKKFNIKKLPPTAFLNYARKAMTQKINRAQKKVSRQQAKEISFQTEVSQPKTLSGDKPLQLQDIVKETREMFAYEQETGVVAQMVAELKKNGKAEKNKQAIQILNALAQGWKPVHIADALHVRRARIAKIIERKILPIAKRFIIKSDSFFSLIKLMENFVRKNKE